MDSLLLKDVKKGQVFYECEHGINIAARALEDARKVDEGYECQCEIIRGDETEVIRYFQHETHRHYLKIYKSPQYLEGKSPSPEARDE